MRLADRPIAWKLAALALAFTAIVLALLGFVVLNDVAARGVAAYVEGGRVWMHAQDQGVSSLLRYHITNDEADYRDAERHFAIPLGIREARAEMDKPQFDRAFVDQRLLATGVDPRDLGIAIFMYRQFRELEPMKTTVAAWASTDADTDELIALADELHGSSGDQRIAPAREAEIFERISALDRHLSSREDVFHESLRDTARLVREAMLIMTLAGAALLLSAGLWLSARISRHVRLALSALSAGAARVASGDLSQPIAPFGTDELGALARAFNEMMMRRRDAEAAVKESEQRFVAAFEQASIGVALATPEGVLIKVNRAFARLLGYECDEIAGRAVVDITHPDDGGDSVEWMRKLIAGAVTAADFEKRYRHKDGHVIWTRVSVTLVRDAELRPVNFIAQVQDISKRKKAESQLQDAQARLVVASRQAGMAEVATSVLHNVGNVLNSVNVSTGLMAESLRKSRTSGLPKVVALLRSHESDLAHFITEDVRGRTLPSYLAQLSDHLVADQEATLRELETLRKHVNHIKEIVAMQQGYAKMGGATETIAIADLVEDSLRMNAESLTKRGIAIERDFAPVPPLTLCRHNVIQILVNLIRNAEQACEAAGGSDGRIVLKVARSDDRLVISVRDNGVGITPANLAKLFSHGFTTRKDGHGFGLHSGAITAREMGGRLYAHSDGPGTGATFTLELPLQPTTETRRETCAA
ncbi:MAG TPA: PAS domain S-box protein [Nevskiaceae bacterium]|nr:PAS domain S-box protein [Nevskiaceae bacterium]